MLTRDPRSKQLVAEVLSPVNELVAIWSIGSVRVIVFAGLPGVPQHLYEAAELAVTLAQAEADATDTLTMLQGYLGTTPKK